MGRRAADTGQRGDTQWIMLQGNPVLWWGILAALALFGALLALARLSRRGGAGRASVVAARARTHRDALLFLLAGYVMNFVPFAFITRPMYLYHYFFGLTYSVALASFAVGVLAGWTDDDTDRLWRFPSRVSRTTYVAMIALVAVSFAYFAPMSYGTALSASAVQHRRWLLEAH